MFVKLIHGPLKKLHKISTCKYSFKLKLAMNIETIQMQVKFCNHFSPPDFKFSTRTS